MPSTELMSVEGALICSPRKDLVNMVIVYELCSSDKNKTKLATW